MRMKLFKYGLCAILLSLSSSCKITDGGNFIVNDQTLASVKALGIVLDGVADFVEDRVITDGTPEEQLNAQAWANGKEAGRRLYDAFIKSLYLIEDLGQTKLVVTDTTLLHLDNLWMALEEIAIFIEQVYILPNEDEKLIKQWRKYTANARLAFTLVRASLELIKDKQIL